jgi:alpha-galactosidase
MYERKIISTFRAGDTTLHYVQDVGSGQVGLEMFPTALADRLVPCRIDLRGQPEIDAIPGGDAPVAQNIDSLFHLKIVGDPYPGAFAQGRTMRNCASIDTLKFDRQDVHGTNVVTRFVSPAGYRLEHRLSWHAEQSAVEITTVFFNDSSHPVTLEMLSSFSLGNITPFHIADASNRLRVHRFRSVWSAEARLDTQTIEQLHLERSWSGSGMFSERFGQIGSMPVRGWFPFVAIEDTQADVLWGAQLAWAGSWQMEIFRQDDAVCISGGLADREFGHWTATLAPGQTLSTPPATLACVQGDLDDLCSVLTNVQHRAADQHPQVEHDLPIIFNEWCTTWGDPSHDKILKIAHRLQGSAVKYLVIDAGWYKSGNGSWDNSHGDWIPSKILFPDGLAATAAVIKSHGLIPGLWFEMETVGQASAAFSLVDHLLQRDGLPITVRSRRFWNLNDPFAIDYLAERVIGLLEQCGFGYLKVDYNETIGIGCDGSGSLGQGLARQVEGIYRFFDQIRRRLPQLVIESCSSGGHRLEPSMIGRTAMSSFSDAHELKEIPIIAANLHQLMLPRQSQIWAVLHRNDDDHRLVYSLAGTFLGRMCLSGEIDNLTDQQWKLVTAAQNLYRIAWPIIKHGMSRRFGKIGQSWRHPSGWQSVVRLGQDGNSALIVTHIFADSPGEFQTPLPQGKPWHLAEQFSATRSSMIVQGDRLICHPGQPFSANVTLLSR